MDINSNSFLPFEIPSQEDWKRAAQQELQGAAPESLVVKRARGKYNPYILVPVKSHLKITRKRLRTIFMVAPGIGLICRALK